VNSSEEEEEEEGDDDEPRNGRLQASPEARLIKSEDVEPTVVLEELEFKKLLSIQVKEESPKGLVGGIAHMEIVPDVPDSCSFDSLVEMSSESDSPVY